MNRTETTPHLATVVGLLAVHLLLAMAAFYLIGINGMNAGMCGFYNESCGNANWSIWGMLFAMGASGLLLVAHGGGMTWRIVKGRNALGFAITMCVLQVFVLLVALMLQGLAGPTS